MKGDVVVVPFPFSDLTHAKRRPALVVAAPPGDDVILCQITSRPIRDQYALSLDEGDFQTGSLRRGSNIRPNRIFTADQGIILYRIGSVAPPKMREVVDRIIEPIRA